MWVCVGGALASLSLSPSLPLSRVSNTEACTNAHTENKQTFESHEPPSVPTMPVMQVTAPNASAAVAELRFSPCACAWRYTNVGAHCAIAPDVNVTAVKPSVDQRNVGTRRISRTSFTNAPKPEPSFVAKLNNQQGEGICVYVYVWIGGDHLAVTHTHTHTHARTHARARLGNGLILLPWEWLCPSLAPRGGSRVNKNRAIASASPTGCRQKHNGNKSQRKREVKGPSAGQLQSGVLH